MQYLVGKNIEQLHKLLKLEWLKEKEEVSSRI